MDDISLLLFFTVLPIILILVFVYNKDKNKEPIKLLLQLFGLGILSCFMVLLLSDVLALFLPFMDMKLSEMNFINTLLYAFIGVAFVEEFCKWVMVYSKGYHNKEFDELYDIIVYAVFVSLGFAFFENIMYVLSSGNLRTAIIRAISAVPGHACDAIFMGYYLSIAKQYHYQKKKDLEKKNVILSIFIPALLHGIYDFCLMSGIRLLVFVFIIFVIGLYAISLKKLKEISSSNKIINGSNVHRFCINCGAKLNGPFCNNCGARQE